MLIKQIHKIENKSITAVDALKYRMSINVKLDGLSLLILQGEETIVALNYQWQESNWEDCSTNFEQILKDNSFVVFNYKSVDVFIESVHSTIIPKEFFKDFNKQDLLSQYLGNNEFMAFSQELKAEDAVLIFGVHKILNTIISKYFVNARVLHSSAMFIDSVLLAKKNNSYISLKVRTNNFEVIAYNDSKLLAHNNFAYKTIDEFMFLLLSFVKQQHFDIDKTRLVLCEDLLLDSKIATQLKMFFSKIEEFNNNANNENEKVFYSLKTNTIIANN